MTIIRDAETEEVVGSVSRSLGFNIYDQPYIGRLPATTPHYPGIEVSRHESRHGAQMELYVHLLMEKKEADNG